VIAMDVVEVCPPYDSSELAAQNANRAVMQVLSALAVKRRKAVQPGMSALHSNAE
jgi:arginase family enzyme